MPEDRNPSDAPGDRQQQSLDRGETRRLAGWQKIAVGISVALTLVGLAVYAAGSFGEAAAPATRKRAPVQPKGFVPTGTSETSDTAEAPAGEGDWRPVLFRLGFSFFVGFCVAYALRAFFKISIVAIGLVLLLLFGLQYAGLIDVDWAAMEGCYDSASAWLWRQVTSLRRFVTGYLPSSASGIAGMAVGLKRR